MLKTGQTIFKLARASGYKTTFLGHPKVWGRESYVGTADPQLPPSTRLLTGVRVGESRQSNVISASSSLVILSPRRADLQLVITDFFLDLETDRPDFKTQCLKADHEGRVMPPDKRSDQSDKTWGQKGPSSKSFKEGSLGAGTAISTLGAVMKQSDQTKWWSEWLVHIGLGGVALQPSCG